jgi:hypothetical protein
MIRADERVCVAASTTLPSTDVARGSTHRRRHRNLATDPDEGEMGFRNVARTLPALWRSAASDPQAGVRRGSNVGRMDMREVRLQG